MGRLNRKIAAKIEALLAAMRQYPTGTLANLGA